jgi:hypothetical protein
MLMILLIVLLVLALGGGTWGHSRYGARGWSPAGLIVLVLTIIGLLTRSASFRLPRGPQGLLA